MILLSRYQFMLASLCDLCSCLICIVALLLQMLYCVHVQVRAMPSKSRSDKAVNTAKTRLKRARAEGASPAELEALKSEVKQAQEDSRCTDIMI